MGTYLKLESYDTVSDYKKRKTGIQHKTGNLVISRKQLKRYTLSLGDYAGHVVSPAGKSFYRSIIDLALKETEDANDSYYYMSEDYYLAEPTFKVMISFFMGMVSARVIAENEFQIPLLFHLSDSSRIQYTLGNDNFVPDFFGVWKDKASGKYMPCLFEAKGQSSNHYVDNVIIEHAKEQLDNISQIKIRGMGTTGSMTTFVASEIKKQVATSSFEHGTTLSEKKWLLCNIDPNEITGEDSLEIDVNKETKAYYDQILSVMHNAQTGNYRHQTERYGNKVYILVEQNGECIGIQKDVYDVVTASDNERNMKSLYSEIIPILKENKVVNTDTYSIGLDGVIYVERR